MFKASSCFPTPSVDTTQEEDARKHRQLQAMEKAKRRLAFRWNLGPKNMRNKWEEKAMNHRKCRKNCNLAFFVEHIISSLCWCVPGFWCQSWFRSWFAVIGRSKEIRSMGIVSQQLGITTLYGWLAMGRCFVGIHRNGELRMFIMFYIVWSCFTVSYNVSCFTMSYHLTGA